MQDTTEHKKNPIYSQNKAQFHALKKQQLIIVVVTRSITAPHP